VQRICAHPARMCAALVVFVLLLVWTTSTPRAADTAKYHTYQELTTALNAAVAAHRDIARIVSIGKTKEGRDLWAVEIANPTGIPVAERPALLVAGNFEGDHVIGSELSLSLVDYLLNSYASDAAVKQRIDTQAFYIVPRVNPDGAELMFAPVRTGRKTNAVAFDADNDGRTDEDGPEDLNKDGQITVMRVKDPKGPYMIDPADPRLMKRADPSKGEQGGYAIYWEGLDKDNDGFIAEDGPGGADINRNFMHQYPYYQPDAGRYMVSEAETRAMLEYVIKHRNIAAILTFGESDNLIVAPSRRGDLGPASPIALAEFADRSLAESRRVGTFQDVAAGGFGGRGGGGGGGMMIASEYEGAAGGRGGAAAAQPAAGGRGGPGRAASTTISAGDIEYFLTISEQYRQMTGIRVAPPVRTPAGAFFEYGYYQFGVPSFSTPGWGMQPRAIPTEPAPAPEDQNDVRGGPMVRQGRGGAGAGAAGGGQAGGRGGAAGAQAIAQGRGGAMPAGDAGGPNYADQRVLRWMDAEKIDGFVKWTPFKHPTLGDVEIGGFKPYELVNPPADRIPDLAAGHARFAMYLSSLFPHLKIAKAEVTAHGGGIYRIKAQIVNTGYLPTALAQGALARAVKPTMVELGVESKDVIAGNERRNFITALAGSNTLQSYEWIVKGKPGSTVTLKVVSQKSGTDSATLTLK
jgi:murein tripeptide amidase MpaA